MSYFILLYQNKSVVGSSVCDCGASSEPKYNIASVSLARIRKQAKERRRMKEEEERTAAGELSFPKGDVDRVSKRRL